MIPYLLAAYTTPSAKPLTPGADTVSPAPTS